MASGAATGVVVSLPGIDTCYTVRLSSYNPSAGKAKVRLQNSEGSNLRTVCFSKTTLKGLANPSAAAREVERLCSFRLGALDSIASDDSILAQHVQVL